ncbi:MAG: EamA family transporter [Acidobacteria bacterium]|jgi:drug/metabolite transporter (DMT)-like permease|nr:EamA family transporter [Acidobacteriota bacterium]
MNPKVMIWASVVLSAVAQICLKHGLNRMRASSSQRSGVAGMVMNVASQPFVWMWGISFVAATGLWLLGLQKLELSYAYPLVSFGYVLVNILSAIFFHERVDRNRWISVAVICAGVMMIAGS